MAEKSSNGNKIVIGYLGTGGYMDQCIELIRLVQNDERFELHFYGPSNIKASLGNKNISLECDRIRFFGPFVQAEKARIIQSVDILFNAYGNGCQLLDYALSNKLYDALEHGKPILTSPNTFMEKLAGPLAYSIEPAHCVDLNALADWYYSFDHEGSIRYAREVLHRFQNENIQTQQAIRERFLQKGREKNVD